MDTQEHDLIEKVKRGDHRAFKKLYDLQVEPLYRFMRQHSQDTAQVEDWVQRAFIKAYKNIASFQGTSRFSTWLFTIALNEMRSDFRRPNIIAFSSEEIQEQSGPVEDDRDFLWEDIMKGWLAELHETKRMVFILYEVEGYSHAEIAGMLNIGESTSRTLLHRAKLWLKTRWETEEKSA